MFQAALCLSPRSVTNLKQVARSLSLLGRHDAAIEVYGVAEAVLAGSEGAAGASGGGDASSDGNWEIHHAKGVCYAQVGERALAEECFQSALLVAKHEATFLALGRLQASQERYREALETYSEALDYSPDSAALLTQTGLMRLRLGDNARAFDALSGSLALDPRDTRTILAAGSIIQDHRDVDVAMVKYRVAAVVTPNSAQLWNNVGMCLFEKGKFVGAIACLRRALSLDPFEWIVAYNLGLAHINTDQFATAFHHLAASINIKNDFAPAYMHLGLVLARLDDMPNACRAYDKSIELAHDNATCRLNYAIALYNAHRVDAAKEQLGHFNRLLAAAPDSFDEDVSRTHKQLERALNTTPQSMTRDDR